MIIMLGTNDTKPQNWAHEAEFVTDYRDLVKSFLDLESNPRVFICRPCPVVGKGNFDMHAALKDKPELLPDRVHPNAKGAGEMAKAAFKALTGKKAPKPAAVK